MKNLELRNCIFIIMAVIVLLQIPSSASEINDMERLETVTEKGINEDDVEYDGIGLDDELEEPSTEAKPPDTEQSTETVTDKEKTYYQGLYYYISNYQYESRIEYLNEYLTFVDLEINLEQKAFDLGESTQLEVDQYIAEKTKVETEIQISKNQMEYNNMYLSTCAFDYAEFSLYADKQIESMDYYASTFPKKDCMTMAGYVTSYKNSKAYIEAQNAQIDLLTSKCEAAQTMFDCGEISELQLKEQNMELKKAQYDLKQYYVEMNLAYANLMIYCCK